MYLAGRWADRQLSRLELVIVVIVLSLILFVLIQHMLKIFARAERSMLANSVMNINTTLQYRAAWHVLKADYAALEAMNGMNPFDLSVMGQGWLDNSAYPNISRQMLSGLVDIRLPASYLGVIDTVEPTSIKGGSWYYDLQQRRLVYRVSNYEYFETDLPGPARVEFIVDIDYKDRNDNNQFDAGLDEYRTIYLRALRSYTWQF